MTYRQSGTQYRQTNFAYNRSDITVTPSTIGVVTTIPTSITFPYNKAGMSYRDSLWAYREPPSSGNQITVICYPTTIGVTTQFSAVAGLPATVSATTVAVDAGVAASIDVDANYVELDEGMTLTVEVPDPALLIGQQIAAATIAATTTMAPTIGVIIGPVDTIAVASTVATSHDVDASYTANAATIGVSVSTPEVPLHRILTPPQHNVVPPVGLRNRPTPAAYALMRHFPPTARGINLVIINNTSVQTFMPADWSTVTRVIYGGHWSPNDLTAVEQDILIAAGYKFRVGTPAEDPGITV
jgi:hypothetical protein|tara:strand:- start:13152 stop:14048 length:897 start_codon:yes stop_codon:yes gene_type:complete